MPTLAQPAPDLLSEDLQPVWRLTVDQYHEMLRAGVLISGDPAELLEGVLVAKAPKNPRLRRGKERTRRQIDAAISQGWYVADQEPITLARSEPEPDLAVIRGGTDDYSGRHPGPSEVALVIEVADSTLGRDRRAKKRIYAEAGIPAYWILNVLEMRLEVFTRPAGNGYQSHVVLAAGDHITFALAGVESKPIAVADLLPL